jgi:hypothetical protein
MRRGRPSKLTDTIAKSIVSLVRRGVDPTVAAGACGVSRTSLFEWRRRGRGEGGSRRATPELVAFAGALERAIDQFEASLVVTLSRSIDGARIAPGRILHTQWMLSKRFPSRWALHNRSGAGGSRDRLAGEGSLASWPLSGRGPIVEIRTTVENDAVREAAARGSMTRASASAASSAAHRRRRGAAALPTEPAPPGLKD